MQTKPNSSSLCPLTQIKNPYIFTCILLYLHNPKNQTLKPHEIYMWKSKENENENEGCVRCVGLVLEVEHRV